MAQQYIRDCSLIVADAAGNGIELKDFRIRFSVRHQVTSTPDNMIARIYNLKSETISTILAMGDVQHAQQQVRLNAGYIEQSGNIFTGNVRQIKVGRENATDTYCDLYCADGDYQYCNAFMSRTLTSGYTQSDVWNACGQSFSQQAGSAGETPPDINPLIGVRGKAMFGMTRDVLRDWTETNLCNWTFRDGQAQALSYSRALPGTAIVVSPETGLIGVPEQTTAGVTFVTLLNAQIRWGVTVRIDSKDISQFQINTPGGIVAPTAFPISQGALPGAQAIASDGLYKCLVVDHIGDTRGQEWYTSVTALAIDQTVQIGVTMDVPRDTNFTRGNTN